MSYLNRAAAVALLLIGIVVIFGMSRATDRAITQHHVSIARHSDAAFTHRLSSHSHAEAHKHRAALPSDYGAWSKVAACEESGWNTPGGEHPDSLGIDVTNYESFGGTPQPAGTPTLQQRVLQIHVADRLIRSYGMAIPDQDGCDGSW